MVWLHRILPGRGGVYATRDATSPTWHFSAVTGTGVSPSHPPPPPYMRSETGCLLIHVNIRLNLWGVKRRARPKRRRLLYYHRGKSLPRNLTYSPVFPPPRMPGSPPPGKRATLCRHHGEATSGLAHRYGRRGVGIHARTLLPCSFSLKHTSGPLWLVGGPTARGNRPHPWTGVSERGRGRPGT